MTDFEDFSAEDQAKLDAFVDEMNLDPADETNWTTTTETLEDFEAARKASWTECADMEIDVSDNGLSFAHYEGVQVRKGDRRTDLWVIDLGHIRACIK